MNEAAKNIAMAIISAASDGGYFDGELASIPELAEQEKELFVNMFNALRTHLTREKRSELTVDEISSMFSFVFARAAEMVTNYVNGKPDKLSMDGLFDGKIPLYADDTLVGFCKKSTWPQEAGRAFLERESAGEDIDPTLALFEALKWTCRISCHIIIRHMEKRHKL